MAIIVIAGTITSGFKHYGPFPDWDAASDFTEGRECRDCEWWIVELIAPPIASEGED